MPSKNRTKTRKGNLRKKYSRKYRAGDPAAAAAAGTAAAPPFGPPLPPFGTPSPFDPPSSSESAGPLGPSENVASLGAAAGTGGVGEATFSDGAQPLTQPAEVASAVKVAEVSPPEEARGADAPNEDVKTTKRKKSSIFSKMSESFKKGVKGVKSRTTRRANILRKNKIQKKHPRWSKFKLPFKIPGVRTKPAQTDEARESNIVGGKSRRRRQRTKRARKSRRYRGGNGCMSCGV